MFVSACLEVVLAYAAAGGHGEVSVYVTTREVHPAEELPERVLAIRMLPEPTLDATGFAEFVLFHVEKGPVLL